MAYKNLLLLFFIAPVSASAKNLPCKVADNFEISLFELNNFIHIRAHTAFNQGHATCEYIKGNELQWLGLWKATRSRNVRAKLKEFRMSLVHRKGTTWHVSTPQYYKPQLTHTVECSLKLKAFND